MGAGLGDGGDHSRDVRPSSGDAIRHVSLGTFDGQRNFAHFSSSKSKTAGAPSKGNPAAISGCIQ
jgi:hypothetical protein